MGNQQAYSVYVSFGEDGRYYIGSKKNIPDNYYGSFSDPTFVPISRNILASNLSLDESQHLESFLQRFLNCRNDKYSANRAIFGIAQVNAQSETANLKRSESQTEWCRNNPEELQNRVNKTAETRKKFGLYNQSPEKLDKIKLSVLKSRVETGKTKKNTFLREETYWRLRRELDENGIDYSPLPIETLRELRASTTIPKGSTSK